MGCIKIIDQLGSSEKALLCELPKAWLEKVEISADGTVDALQLLEICLHAERELENCQSLTNDLFLMNVIFGDFSVDGERLSKMTQLANLTGGNNHVSR